MTELTIHQQLKLRLFTDNLKQLSEQEIKELLIKMFTESMIQQNYYSNLMATKWGIK